MTVRTPVGEIMSEFQLPPEGLLGARGESAFIGVSHNGNGNVVTRLIGVGVDRIESSFQRGVNTIGARGTGHDHVLGTGVGVGVGVNVALGDAEGVGVGVKVAVGVGDAEGVGVGVKVAVAVAVGVGVNVGVGVGVGVEGPAQLVMVMVSMRQPLDEVLVSLPMRQRSTTL